MNIVLLRLMANGRVLAVLAALAISVTATGIALGVPEKHG